MHVCLMWVHIYTNVIILIDALTLMLIFLSLIYINKLIFMSIREKK